MKAIPLLLTLLLSTSAFAQLPPVIGKKEAAIHVYCDSLMKKLQLTKKEIQSKSELALLNGDSSHVLIVDWNTDKKGRIEHVILISQDIPYIRSVFQSVYEGKNGYLGYLGDRCRIPATEAEYTAAYISVK